MYQKYKASATVFKIAPNQPIRMLSEGSCDTEDWSNNAENSALLSQEKKSHLKLKWNIKH